MNISEEQGNTEAHEKLMITDEVQCSSSHTYATLRHTYCECGIMLTGKVKKLRYKLSRTSSVASIFTRQAQVFSKLERPEERQLFAARTPMVPQSAWPPQNRSDRKGHNTFSIDI